MTLKELCAKYHKNGWPDKDTVHSYIEVYEEILSPYRQTAKNILEIGLMSGESLRMWTEYFSGNVWGIDCSETPIDGMADLRPLIAEGSHRIVIGDATSKEDINKHFKGVKFSVIIEDASHDISQQLAIYKTLKPYLNKGFIYIIEDVQDIDATRFLFENIDTKIEVSILDRRGIKFRYDDILVIITDK